MRRFVTYGPALLVLLAIAVTLIAAPAAIRQISTVQMQSRVALAQARLDQDSILERINQANRAVADATLPGLVHIQAGSFRGAATGAGWIYDDDGHIVTNAHVVRDFTTVRVELFDGRIRTGRVIGKDELTDIAVIGINPGAGVVPLRRATDEPVYIGDRVFALGSPFDIKFSMSEGIISGLGRSEAANFLGMIAGYTNFIQTDAAMNPGNSGGPLIDVNGKVIGMSTAIANNTQPRTGEAQVQGQSAGIGFAIPLETIESVVAQILGDNTVIRGYLGISLGPPDPDDVRALGYDGLGVIVADAPANHPAARSGLEADDVIIAIDGRETPDQERLRSIVSVLEPGKPIPVVFFRDGEVREADVVLGAAFNAPPFNTLSYIPGSERMSRREIVGRIERQLAVHEALTNAGLDPIPARNPRLIIEVRNGSPADRAGLRDNMVITSVNGEQVTGWPDMLAVLAENPDRRLDVVMDTDGGGRYDLDLRVP